MDESCCQTGKNKTKLWTFNLLLWKCSIFSKGFNYTQEEQQCVVHLSTIWWSGAPPRAVKNKKKLGGSAAMQGGLWACTQRPFDLSVNNSMILAIDLSPSSHIGMKLPVNTGVVKKKWRRVLFQWIFQSQSSELTCTRAAPIWPEWNRNIISIIADMFVAQELSLIFIRQDGPGLAWYSRDSFPVGISAILEFLKI